MATLKELRTRKYLSKRQLALKAGVNSATISRIEKGIHRPNDVTLQKLADALGIKPEEIKFEYTFDVSEMMGNSPENK
jgi:transcriptional regulator with XRE-family HTH domain